MASPALVSVKTVVVADDTAFVRDRFKTAIEAAGHRAVTVQSGPDLLTYAREAGGGVDLVVLDLRLPQGRGTKSVRMLRRIDALKAPIVVFSGTIASADEVRELAALGVAGYVNEYTSVQHIVPALAPHLFPDHYNRRSSPRVVLAIPISYRFGNTIAAALTLNMSRGGLAVRTTSPLEVDTTLKVRFRLPTRKKDVEAEARVAWVDRRTGMGLQFTKISAGDQKSIEEFVQAHFFTNRKA
ncbi:MAG TPA: response regulator [Vicinamibacterales bacterium]